MCARLILAALVALAGGPAPALEMSMPGNATLNTEEASEPDRYALPVGAYADGALPVQTIEGRVAKQAWRIEQSGLTTLQIVRVLQEQLAVAGYEILFECGGQECGGFDFRFGTYVMSAPDMYVDLFDFRFLSARGPQRDAVSVFVSKSAEVGYVQVVQVVPDGSAAKRAVATVKADAAPEPAVPEVTPGVIEALTTQGHVILSDLDFGTGSSALGPGPHDSLETLAEYLLANENRRIALVGHTDLVGSLADNVKLSKARASSVLARLTSEYGVPRVQLDAEGVGYLSPLAPNSTRMGRETNRRVEAVLLRAE